ncbi:AbrB/MazE/SpoVT family DNA-binding domain-containing protein [Alcanivorax quisquiliarum]|uniref:AbrB/MazE/SpoVT family DNA-binding domain-containing protein n=1 Tax=Alcanivorax quisquiliarum TaxID=2933565 RepID=A0ABT0EAH9_9GAMM|nr:AbrB/MazE/SpoVT family DNA-binding domain-containing protein [Alcanivorax quisquiliarum]MCK0538841.1 AbrB/MazE/SpoVT family DNA-binding domain-containing protein [Alcanivorax quisquiliarum]
MSSKAKIRRMGNSQGVLIPRPLLAAAGLKVDESIEITPVDGKLVIARATPELSLDELLGGITEANLHGEVDSGAAVGVEAL